jgi:hypothetical protein
MLLSSQVELQEASRMRQSYFFNPNWPQYLETDRSSVSFSSNNYNLEFYEVLLRYVDFIQKIDVLVKK